MNFPGQGPFTELYEVLGLTPDATKAEIRKAYHKLALQHHPDKVAEEERIEAEVRFKAVSEAYETLYDEDKRAAYDRYGPSDGPQGMGGMGPGDVDIDDLLSHMFGMGFEGPPPGARGPPRKRKGQDVTQSYDITLEDLYKGKTVKFSSTRDILCKTCKGVGGKDKSKERECVACKGKGWNTTLRSVGGGMVVQDRHPCGSCDQTGKVFREKDRCKKCKGKKVQEEKKVLELYIPRGSQDGDKVVLEGEADEAPGFETGNIIFVINELPHERFVREGANLSTTISITLRESLVGFSRVVTTHLDGRGIHVSHPSGKPLKPGQALRIENEGMPRKKTDMKGDLFLIVEVEYPDEAWFKNPTNLHVLDELLPKKEVGKEPEHTDEVDFTIIESAEDIAEAMGQETGWSTESDDDEEYDGDGPQCAQQ